MPYGQYNPQPTNNLWFGNNYSSGNSQMSRSQYNPIGMPVTSPMTNPMPQQQQMVAPQTMNNILQVMGPEAAVAFQVGPNSHVTLMDMNRSVFYMKRSDDSGYSETKAYQFFEIPLFEEKPSIETNAEVVTDNNYVTKEDLAEFKTSIEESLNSFKSMIEELVGAK